MVGVGRRASFKVEGGGFFWPVFVICFPGGGGGTPILRVSMDVRFLKKYAPMMGGFWGIPAPIIPFLEILPSLGVQNDPIFAH